MKIAIIGATAYAIVRGDIMKLADEYAGRSFDQGLHQRTLDEAPEEAREVLRKALAKALHRAQKEGK